MIRPERRDAAIVALTALIVLSAVAVVAVIRPSSAATITWSVASSPAGGNQLNGVSCESAPRCVAVGYRTTAQGVRQTLAQTTTDTTWTVMPTPNRGIRDNVLAAVSCPGPARCVAVGSNDNGNGVVTLVETWNGTTWTTTPSPNPGVNASQLAAVSCPTPTKCVAVGNTVDTTGYPQTLVEIWNGTTWTTTPSPSPSTSRAATLKGVSCPTPTTCVAVGSAVDTTGHLQTLVETWNGTTWTTTPSPNPGGNTRAILTGVSCATATSCVAVGNYDNGIGVHRTLVETWNGTTWVRNTSNDPSSSSNYLRSVSCWKTGKCIAVGWWGSDNSRKTLVESLTGTAWTISSTPATGGAINELSAASCASITDCVAVGRTANGNAEHPLVLSGSTPPDVTAPSIVITRPHDRSYYVVGQVVRAQYVCPDEPGGSGTASCIGTIGSGAVIDTSSAAERSFSVSATDFTDNTASTTVGYTVVEPASSSSTAPAGGASITTDPGGGPTPQIPVATTLTSSDAGPLSIDQDAVTLVPPAGLTLLGIQIETTAPAPTGTPLQLTFDLDAALLPSSATVTDLVLLKDAASVPDCPGATTLPVGEDACISNRGDAPSAGGDLRLTALAASAGQWNLAVGTAAAPRASVGNGSVVEPNTGTALLQVPVSLSQPSALPVSVSYATADQTAHAGPDYAATAGTLNFAAGQTVMNVAVTVTGDTGHETNETFALTLSSPSGATLGPPGTETIADNDPIAPAAPSVQAVSNSTLAKLSWTLPASNGAPITSYQVRVYDNGVLQTSKSHTVTCTQPCTPARTWTVTGLPNNKQYMFTVSAQNAKGSGPAGSTTILVNDITSGGVLPGRPAAPHAAAGAARATLTWAAPLSGTGTITIYTLTPYKNGVLQSAVMVGQNARSFVFTNLTAGATYTFRVTPRSPVGPGSDSVLSNPVKPT